jgi:hypothetical protein
MRGRYGAPGLAAVLVLLWAPPLAAAEPLPPITARLEYTRPPECPAESDLHYEVARRLGKDPFVKEGLFRVVATIARQKNKLIGDLAIYDGDGQTVAEKHSSYPPWDCAELLEGFAITLSLHLDPEPLPPAPAKAPPAPPPAPPLALPPPVPVPVPVPSPSPSIPPLPPKRSLQLVVGLDGIFTPFLAPSASAGFALWAGIDLLNAPLSFELDLRSAWSLAPAQIPLAYQPLFAVRTSYVGGVLAGCWRGPLSLCPVLEVGSMSFSRAGNLGEVIEPSLVVATGGRVVYARPIAERFVVRGLFELEGVVKPFFISDVDTKHATSGANPLSFTWGVGFGGPL